MGDRFTVSRLSTIFYLEIAELRGYFSDNILTWRTKLGRPCSCSMVAIRWSFPAEFKFVTNLTRSQLFFNLIFTFFSNRNVLFCFRILRRIIEKNVF